MKKIFTLCAVLAIMLSFTACKKDYTCECVLASDPPVSAQITINGTKKKAQEACEAESTTLGGVAYDCAIK